MLADHADLVAVHQLIDQGRAQEAESVARHRLKQADPVVDQGQRADWLGLLGRALDAQNCFSEALEAYAQAVDLRPDSVQMLLALGDLQRRHGAFEAAERCCRMAIACDALAGSAVELLGRVFEASGESRRAVESFQAIVKEQPGQFTPLLELGKALLRSGAADEALEHLLVAVALSPKSTEPLLAVGQALMAINQHQQAFDVLAQGLELEPTNVNLLRQLGDCFLDLGLFDHAIVSYREALEVQPHEPTLLGRLAGGQRHIGELDASMALLDSLIARFPQNPDLYQLQLFNYSIVPGAQAAQGLDLARRYWDLVRHDNSAAISSSVVQPSPVAAGLRCGSGRIKVGFLSAEIGSHVVSCFLRSFLRHYDRSAFEVELISVSRRFEHQTAAMIRLADAHVSLKGLSTEEARSVLRGRHYQILVDTSGFTRDSGLPLLAERCAPVQCHYIGFHASTGLDTLDYFIGDQELTPDSFACQFSEHLVRLPRAWIAYDMDETFPDAVSTSTREEPILGSFNQIPKLREATLSFWAAALRMVPRAVMVIKDRGAINVSVQQRIRTYLEGQGVEAERVLFYPAVASRHEHLECYNGIDVALDATPWSSSTTAFEALGMGVPLAAIRGDCPSARMSSSIVRNLGQPDWTASDPAAYAEIVARLCCDLEGLRRGKARLQRRFRASSLCDGIDLATNLESAFRRMVLIPEPRSFSVA